MSQNLLNLDAAQLDAFFAEIGEKPFRAKQLMRWMHHFGVSDFEMMSDLSKPLREKLSRLAAITPPGIKSQSHSADGTRKWLLDVGGANYVETVFIPAKNRGTLCISSQVGCALECSFCSTGKQGFNRNLTTAEIIGQLWWANKALKNQDDDHVISNVVMMGMGEPLLNFDALVTALHLMLDDSAYGLSRRRVTVSTSGIVPAMDRLRDQCPVALAVSLHAPDDALRDQLVPINKKYPLAALLKACWRYLDNAPRDFITFEYVMLAGVNDAPEQARALIKLIGELPCKFNLIPFNPFPQSGYQRSSTETIHRFGEILSDQGFITTTRKTRGEDIDAACGQLAGQVRDKTRRALKKLETTA